MATAKMKERIDIIADQLNTKSALKQVVFRNAIAMFEDFKKSTKKIANTLASNISTDAKNVEVEFTVHSDYEFHIKFGGDTMVFLMHTNVFTFPTGHAVNKTNYIKSDPNLGYFGMVQIYNFLSDSIKYNRQRDKGYLLGRIFINTENHFYMEGKRQLGFLYKNPEKNIINNDVIKNIIERSMAYCLDFDLFVPPSKNFELISIEQKNYSNNPTGLPTGKRLGFMSE